MVVLLLSVMLVAKKKANPKIAGKFLRSPKWTALTTRGVIIGPTMVTLVPPAIGPYNGQIDITPFGVVVVVSCLLVVRVVNCGTVQRA